ncbi:hypothetical protein HDV00_009521 [Rhizophlyctis rosea]|nr:hypothetical protein HDV00_009521 [Rhizophlyctis rosea]
MTLTESPNSHPSPSIPDTASDLPDYQSDPPESEAYNYRPASYETSTPLTLLFHHDGKARRSLSVTLEDRTTLIYMATFHAHHKKGYMVSAYNVPSYEQGSKFDITAKDLDSVGECHLLGQVRLNSSPRVAMHNWLGTMEMQRGGMLGVGRDCSFQFVGTRFTWKRHSEQSGVKDEGLKLVGEEKRVYAYVGAVGRKWREMRIVGE